MIPKPNCQVSAASILDTIEDIDLLCYVEHCLFFVIMLVHTYNVTDNKNL